MLEGSASEIVYQVGEVGGDNYPDLYNFPFLFHSNGDPWKETNDYLLSLMRDKAPINRRTDDVRRRASKLIDYLLFCEDNNLDWLDFSGARPPLRPTYKYFYHLINEGTRSNQVINQYTGVVYHFYKYVSEHWHDLDMKRVDTIKQVRFIVKGYKGVKVVEAEKRSQTQRTPPVSSVPLGFVREDGEDLRPLSNRELGAFLSAVRNEKEWSAVERLILMASLMTGARKQTVLTMRLKHLKGFTDDKLEREGAYKLHAGPRTGIDTKYDKPQVLYVPKQLAEELVTLAKSPMMKKRREKFSAQLESSHPGLSVAEDNMYLFLSDQGNCYYMAKSDPRYTIVKSPQAGQVTETIKRKLILKASSPFPKDFSYHWLRATFAYQLYQRLQVLVQEGALKPGEDIDFIQKRMHHESRETTENYLKLFKMTHEKVMAQEIWEGKLFNGGYAVLKVAAHDE
ncbi:site-specific integrase [Pseudomonas stutzeri]|uniref:site-specific integrase n=1 Tax=Stutzerimonas stutzeri TaxID=316 RepID=UPI00210B7F95|nr:site-specific integrase [Stutzerimonas stutzeri]MCQ4289362.1 site-specific integrase [Stutzerimonas stutzeri]